jgi:hypothetical protein
MTRALLLCLLLLAACGSADELPIEELPEEPHGPLICTKPVDGHKVTFYCRDPR